MGVSFAAALKKQDFTPSSKRRAQTAMAFVACNKMGKTCDKLVNINFGETFGSGGTLNDATIILY